MLVAHLEQPVPPLRAPGGTIPADVEAVIRRCLEKDPSDRYPEVLSLENALAHCMCSEEWTQSKAAGWWQEHTRQDLSSAPEATRLFPA
jgi:serine/threonine-protein kinase